MLFTIVGLKYYIKEWGSLDLKSVVDLVPEPENKYDKQAIACFFKNNKIGYVSNNQNKDCKKFMKKTKKTKYKVCMKKGLIKPILLKIKEEDNQDENY